MSSVPGQKNKSGGICVFPWTWAHRESLSRGHRRTPCNRNGFFVLRGRRGENPSVVVDFDSGDLVGQFGELLDVAAPPVSIDDAKALAREHFGLDATVKPLGGERDHNFHLQDQSGEEFVLKVIHPAEDPDVSDFQSRMLLHIEAADPDLATPRVVRLKQDNGYRVLWHTDDQSPRWVRCLTYLAGCPLNRAERSPVQKRNIGTFLGRLDFALRDFRHPAENHDLLWDTKHAARVRPLLVDVSDEVKRAAADRALDHFAKYILPNLPHMRNQVIHNDFNPHNVLAGSSRNDEITGVIDFGDAVRSPLVQDLAVAAAYQFEPTGHPLEGPAQVAAAFHAVYPLLPEEVEILPDLIATRFALAIAISYWRAAKHPDNADYIMRNQAAAWLGLQRLNETPRDEAITWLRRRIEQR